MKCAILIFSSRENGNCAGIGRFVANYHQTDVQTFTVDDSTVSGCGHCNYQCLTPGLSCPNLRDNQIRLMDELCASDLVYFVVPNYCGYPPSSYFAFNEKTVGYFNLDRQKMSHYMNIPKRFIIVSNSEGFEAAMQQQTSAAPDILYLKSGKYKKRSTAGDILESEEAVADLQSFLDNKKL